MGLKSIILVHISIALVHQSKNMFDSLSPTNSTANMSVLYMNARDGVLV